MKLRDLEMWLEDNPPTDMPFWPGAKYTGRMGLRTSREVLDAGASPIHLGVDRAGGGRFTCPFDARVTWKHVGGAAGTLLQIRAKEIPLEIQVFHTKGPKEMMSVDTDMRRGEGLPVMPSDLGLSVGVHTHTEVLIPYRNAQIYDWVRSGTSQFVSESSVNQKAIEAHCRKHDLHYQSVLQRALYQVKTWMIVEAADRYAVRQEVPSYRTPGWSSRSVPTLHVDSKWLLQI
jgi:hypothetical protein